MLTARDALAKTLAKFQKVTFWSKKNGFGCFFFFLIDVNALIEKHFINSFLKQLVKEYFH